jgi:hypothetical protein
VNPLTIAVVGVLSVWFLMTAVVQFPVERWRRIRRYDPVGHLLPGWHFFAPKPIRADFAVWYRSWAAYDVADEVREDAALTWVELAGIDQRRITDAAVNPGRLTRKSIFTCALRIVAMLRHPMGRSDPATGLPSDAIMLSLPYLLLAERASTVCHGSQAVQFRIDVIGYERGIARPRTIFRSAVHRIDPAESDPTHLADVARA